MKFIVLAGGSGTRLWPLSRKNFPKQFLKVKLLNNGQTESFFQKTLKRILLYPETEIFVVTNEKYKFYISAQIEEITSSLNNKPNIEIILEPAQKNTAPAIALALKYALEKGISYNETFLVCPSDHLIYPEMELIKYLNLAERIAKDNNIVTFGVVPNRPETGFGYIKVENNEINSDFYKVEKFVEKPDIESAKKYIQEGVYYWNSGMFCFNANSIIDEFRHQIPQLAELFDFSLQHTLDNFNKLPNISIDYAVMEKTKKAVLIPLNIFWSDIGSWENLYEVFDKDENGNVVNANSLNINTKNTLIIGDKRLITTIGLEDSIIVETEDALLIAKKGECQKVKDVVNFLSEKQISQVEEHVTSYRPWGSFTLLEKGERYKIKRITVNPGHSLSLQMHHHRSEHWIVVRGTAKVTIGEREIYVHENESVYVPKSTLHRLENPGKIVLEIIEVQVGEYVEEDDIKRFDDLYGR
jgi:mannose-1-phosphate guanylyltransferase/mannose-6-phosphate isomerase